MSDIKVGDIRVSVIGEEIEVLAIKENFVWTWWAAESSPRTSTLEVIDHHTAPKPDFFEEKKTYLSRVTNKKWTVWHVLEVSGKKVAVVQDTGGASVILLVQSSWDSGHYKEL